MFMKSTDMQIIYDPRGVIRFDTAPISTRKKVLNGLRLGVLDNSKWNANKILRGAVKALSEDIDFSQVNYYVKHSFSKDAEYEECTPEYYTNYIYG